MRVVGFLCGVGSLLWEARALGFRVVGNVDTRSYFRDGKVWSLNFPEAPFVTKPEDVPSKWYGADLALGHPPCGSHSLLGMGTSGSIKNAAKRAAYHDQRSKNLGLLPLFAHLVNEHQPKIFALDNLPRIMHRAAPEAWWIKNLPGYRMTFLIVKNWDYGSCQTRERLWVIGSRGRPFVFQPPKRRLQGPENVWDAIRDLPWQPWVDVPELTHMHLQPSDRPLDSYWLRHGRRYDITLQSDACAQGFLSLRPDELWPYVNRDSVPKRKPGKVRLGWERCKVFGGQKDVYHPLTAWPLTQRERARIFGWPDDFRLWDVERWGWSKTIHRKLVWVTGRAVPSHFPRYLIPQLRDHARSF